MKRILVFFAAFLFAGALGGAFAGADPDRIPYTLTSTFETSEMEGWETYPYAQDIGWDPRLTCTVEPSRTGSKYSLARMVEPNDVVGLEEGFTRQMDMWTSASTRMKFLLFLTADRCPETLEMSLCLFDGSRYFHTVKAPQVNRWITLDIPLRAFAMQGRPLESGRHIQAVTIKATYPLVSDFISYTINLDDFALSGERQRRFVAVDPASTTFEMFQTSALHRHFYYGDALTVRVKPENAPGKAPVTGVTCTVLDPSGKAVVSNAPLARNGGVWTANTVHTFSANDPRGQWKIDFTGRDSRGGEIRWGFTFLMPGNRLNAGNHPRLHFTAEELRKRIAEQSPEEKKILDAAVSSSESFLKTDVSSITEYTVKFFNGMSAGGPYSVQEGQNWRPPMARLGGIIETGAWRYAFAGDERAGMKAKEALLKLASFRMWTGAEWYKYGRHVHYPLGYATTPAAIGYDLLYPLLSEAERKTVRDAILEKSIKPVCRNLVEMDRMPSNLSNHIAVLVQGALIGAAAIYGDDAGYPAVEPWLSGLLVKTKAFIDRTYYPDGGYGEPIGYQDMATRDLVQALYVLERNFGIDYTTTTGLKDTYLYPLYATYTNGVMPDFGDVSPRYNLSGNTFTWLSYRTGNPWTYEFARKGLEQGHGGVLGWLWYPKGITPKSRAGLPPSRLFPVKGNMVMRSDWSDSASILAFRCGPNSNHYHVDQGTFQLYTNGEALLTDAGHGSSYYANLYYPCYYTQPIGHNCLLIDDNAESQWPADYENGVTALRNYPRITHAFAGIHADEAEGDLTCVYRGAVTGYTRSLLFLKPDILVLFDKIGSGKEHAYNWLFHAEHTDGKSSITYNDGMVRIDRPKARLDMRVLAPEMESGRIRNSDRDESFITLTTAGNLRDTEFLAVLRPSATNGVADPVKPLDATLLKPSGWIGAKVNGEDGTTLAFFRTGASAGKSSAEGFATDAERFAVEIGSDGAVRTLFLRGSEFEGRGVTLKSRNPLSVSAVFPTGGGGLELETDTSAATEIVLGLPTAPSSVTVNGASSDGWKYDAGSGRLRVSLPAGHALVKAR